MKRIAGCKQVIKALSAGGVKCVYLALDTDESMKDGIRAACAEAGVSLKEEGTKKELGLRCGLAVPCAAMAEYDM